MVLTHYWKCKASPASLFSIFKSIQFGFGFGFGFFDTETAPSAGRSLHSVKEQINANELNECDELIAH